MTQLRRRAIAIAAASAAAMALNEVTASDAGVGGGGLGNQGVVTEATAQAVVVEASVDAASGDVVVAAAEARAASANPCLDVDCIEESATDDGGVGDAGNATDSAADVQVVAKEEAPLSASPSSVLAAGSPGSPPAGWKPASCGLWLAPSTIPNAGLGMYAGRDFKSGEDMQETGDVVVPIVDMRNHVPGHYPFLWEEYTWNGDNMGMGFEGLVEVNAASPGFGSAANSYLPLVNVEEQDPVNSGSLDLHRSADPGAGAFTAYGNRRSTAKRNIAAGEELYVDYGGHWFESRLHFGPVPLYNHLDSATILVKRFRRLYEGLQVQSSKTGTGDAQADRKFVDGIVLEVWDEFVRNTRFHESRTIGSFQHNNPEEIRLLLRDKAKTMKSLRLEQSSRSLEWLEENGTCGDHVRAGLSTLKQAGRGAFATRDLPRGTVVGQLPMVHISHKDQLRMRKLVPDPERPDNYVPEIDLSGPVLRDEGGQMVRPKVEAGWQLLVNYCYGHHDSTLLLCPYGPMINYVNHNQTMANVELRWSDPKSGNHMPRLLEEPISTLETDATAKLAMEFVATRDIQEGEEIFLDYGDEWEMAWRTHVAEWKPADGAHSYVSALDLGRMAKTDPEFRIKTEFEQIDEPYPSAVQLFFRDVFLGNGWKHAVRTGTMRKFIEKLPESADESLLECDVMRYRVDAETGMALYTAVVYLLEYDEHDNVVQRDAQERSDLNRLVVDVPAEAFAFRDRPYTTDMFLENAFRHYIGIPDEIFPDKWRNRV